MIVTVAAVDVYSLTSTPGSYSPFFWEYTGGPSGADPTTLCAGATGELDVEING